MKNITILLVLLSLAGCFGPSDKEIDDTATITCNIMSESRNMDSAMRIREINQTREKLGLAPFLGSDEDIKAAMRVGLCKDLVKNSPDFETKYGSAAAYHRAICYEENQILVEICMNKAKDELSLISCANVIPPFITEVISRA